QSGDLGGIDGLIDALIAAKIAPLPLFLPSLKDAAARDFLAEILPPLAPPVVLTTTAFAMSAPGAADRQQVGPNGQLISDCSPLSGAPDAMLLQVPLSSQHLETWRQSAAGLGPRDVAMHVSLPEIDGRVLGPAVSFKTDDAFDPLTELRKVAATSIPDRAQRVADLTAGWADLRTTANADKRIAIVMANYPNRDARIGNGVGLDTPASVCAMLAALCAAGYDVGPAGEMQSAELIDALLAGTTNAAVRIAGDALHRPVLPLAAYTSFFQSLPQTVQDQITERWGAPAQDPMVAPSAPETATDTPGEGSALAFHLPAIVFGKTLIAVQPARGYNIDPKETYHDPALVPPHDYVAFYLWLRHVFGAQAVVHAGKHGNLEWLPGKALALSGACFPDTILGGLPHIYPFIVNDPGEGSQAKRRTAAVIVDHLTPPLTRAESHGTMASLEVLTDEYYQAQPVDARRAAQLARDILTVGDRDGLLADLGLSMPRDTDRDAMDAALTALDAHLCDLKELQIRDGLHVFGEAPTGDQRRDLAIALARVPTPLRPGIERDSAQWAQSSLLRALAVDFKLSGGAADFDPLDCDFAAVWTGERPAALAAVSDSQWRTAGDTVERLEIFSTIIADTPGALPTECNHTRQLQNTVLADHLQRIGDDRGKYLKPLDRIARRAPL
ncbi:MAG: cobaltochelatase subunit CobN, partial [Pseudomonadota bacterium]